MGTNDELMRLPCDNIGEFIDEKKTFYTIVGNSGLKKSDKVLLYRGDLTYELNVRYIHRIRGNDVLALATW